MKSFLCGALAGLALLAAAGCAQAGTLFAGNAVFGGILNGVMEFNAADITDNGAGFGTNGHIAGLATDGVNVYVSLPGGISEFTTAGVLEHTYKNGAFDSFGLLAVKDGTLYAANAIFGGAFNAVMEFDANDMTATGGGFLTNGHIAGLATDGTSIFASLPGGIASYDAAGDVLNFYKNGAFDSFGPLALSDGTLYAANAIFGGLLNAVTDFNAADLTQTGGFFLTDGIVRGLATDGTSLYATLPSGIQSYSLAGDLLNFYKNGAFDKFEALAVSPAVIPPPPPPPPPPPGGVPEPQTWLMMLVGMGGMGHVLRRAQASRARAISRAA